MVIEIPVNSDFRNQLFTIGLDGTVYQIDMDYNGRMDRWLMSISRADGTPVLSQIPVQTDVDNTSRYPFEDLPPGAFIPINENGSGADATEDTLGKDVKLVYIEEDEDLEV